MPNKQCLLSLLISWLNNIYVIRPSPKERPLWVCSQVCFPSFVVIIWDYGCLALGVSNQSNDWWWMMDDECYIMGYFWNIFGILVGYFYRYFMDTIWILFVDILNTFFQYFQDIFLDTCWTLLETFGILLKWFLDIFGILMGYILVTFRLL